MGRFFKWLGITFGGLFALLFITAMGFGLATEVGVFPATLVQTGEELPKKQHEALKEANIVDRDEVIKFYYFEGLFDPAFGGSVMTDMMISRASRYFYRLMSAFADLSRREMLFFVMSS